LVPFLGGALKIAIIGIANAFDVVVDSISAVISGIQKVISLGKTIGGGIANLFGGARAAGGPVANGSTYLVGEKGPELFTPSRSGYIVPNNKLGGGQTFNITVNGAIDPVATAIQIQNILTNEANRAGNWVGGLGTSRFAN
jgi:phage-related minor tail protein